jgi:hypothetical protein
MGSDAALGTATPASMSAGGQPVSTSFTTVAGVANVASNDPARWTDARWMVDSYLSRSSSTSVYGLSTAPRTAPVSMSALAAPRGGLYTSPGGVR